MAYDLSQRINRLKNYNGSYSPLIQAQAKKRRYLVILTERNRSIFYTLFSGILEEHKFITNDTVPQDVKGDWSDSVRSDRHDKPVRHVREQAHHQFKYIAGNAAEFVKSKSIAGVILGGHKSDMGQFEKYLPKHLRGKVVGKCVSELKTNFNDILAKSIEVVEDIDRKISNQSYHYKTT